MTKRLRVGSWINNQAETEFRVWAPNAKKVDVVLESGPVIQMHPEERGYFYTKFSGGLSAGYRYLIDDQVTLPDPASKYQPEGVLGPSWVVSSDYVWTDQKFQPCDFSELVIYELHIGTFTPEGTFTAAALKLDYLKELGINAIEIMPIAQFSGQHNWGYDGVGLFAVQNSYDQLRPAYEGLKFLVNECHQRGISVILDVVYNHLGPEGNYLPKWGPYFQDKYKSPWGESLNFDGPYSDEVRNFFLQNVEQWFYEYHIDGLRLDAIHAIFDISAKTFLDQIVELKERIQKDLNKKLFLIAESDANNPDILESEKKIGMTAHWADDLHHVLHSLLTGETEGYYADYGQKEQLAQVFNKGLIFEGQYSTARKRSHGKSYSSVSRKRLLVCSQNHDQIGNRGRGERLISLVGEQQALFAAACVFVSGAMPMLFMGEEYGEDRPFLYFVDHEDAELKKQVREGRKKEFQEFSWGKNIPDPCEQKTFARSKMDWSKLQNSRHQNILKQYKQLIELSKLIRREGFFEDASVMTSWSANGNLTVKAKDLMIQINFNKDTVPNFISSENMLFELRVEQKQSEVFYSIQIYREQVKHLETTRHQNEKEAGLR